MSEINFKQCLSSSNRSQVPIRSKTPMARIAKVGAIVAAAEGIEVRLNAAGVVIAGGAAETTQITSMIGAVPSRLEELTCPQQQRTEVAMALQIVFQT